MTAQETVVFAESPQRRWSTSRLVALVIAAVAASLSAAPASAAVHRPTSSVVAYAAPSPDPPGGIYAAIPPRRVLDTRVGHGATTPGRDSILSVRVAGTAGVPGGATAVVVNLTVTNTTDAGFVSVWPTGRPRPLVSSLNPQRSDQTIANLVTVPIGKGGRISLYTQRRADLIVDIQGYYTPAEVGRVGRLKSIAPTRVLDTRVTGSRFGIRAERTFNLVGVGGITRKSRAAVLNVTVDDAFEKGFWSVYPAKTRRPEASNLNIEFTGQTIANQVVVGLTNGRFSVYSQRGGELIVDLVGSYTGTDAPPSAEGRFVSVNPTRLLDTRGGYKPLASTTTEVPIHNRAGLGANGIAAVALNVTVTESTDAGYFTVWHSRTYRPFTSNINAASPDETIANHVVTPISGAGVGVFTQRGGHLIADISGYFTGQAIAANLPPPVPVQNTSAPGSATDFAYSLALNGNRLEGGTRSGDPIRWDPCRSIRYVVNYGNERGRYKQLVREAFDRLSAATGLRFVDRGESSFIPTSASPHPFSPEDAYAGRSEFDVLVAFADSKQTDSVPGSVAGVANVAWVGPAGVKPDYVIASVVVDHQDVSDSPLWSSVGAGPVLLHELGHVVGLAHSSAKQLMSPVARPGGPPSFRRGDLAGLWHVGAFPVRCGPAETLAASPNRLSGTAPDLVVGWETQY
ncbi:MAG: hypothetical protein IH940_02325 [Acidobacteria bacterium]|nr:hypothetical protein [Acidobacteriota bacterium]